MSRYNDFASTYSTSVLSNTTRPLMSMLPFKKSTLPDTDPSIRFDELFPFPYHCDNITLTLLANS
jgi:hypothetical protein